MKAVIFGLGTFLGGLLIFGVFQGLFFYRIADINLFYEYSLKNMLTDIGIFFLYFLSYLVTACCSKKDRKIINLVFHFTFFLFLSAIFSVLISQNIVHSLVDPVHRSITYSWISSCLEVIVCYLAYKTSEKIMLRN